MKKLLRWIAFKILRDPVLIINEEMRTAFMEMVTIEAKVREMATSDPRRNDAIQEIREKRDRFEALLSNEAREVMSKRD